ncbi:MAG: Bax inhibitor-1/YccA family protein [Deltaproteobacteria bacterium]|jgi:FtsH-binding integral membrane protein|nr:Bax inhibitor-1/YccA family protein [Deltaproteobacteria bacterium]
MANYNGPPNWGPGKGPNPQQPQTGQGQQPGQQSQYGSDQRYYGQGQQYGNQWQNGATMAMPSQATLIETSEVRFFQNVYLWMLSGLLVTAATALAVYNSNFRTILLGGTGIWIAIFLVQIGLVMLIGFLSAKVSTMTLRGLFLLYSASVGVTFSILLVFYPHNVIFKAFLSTAAVYGGLSAYGLVTKRSLKGIGTFAYMALFGLIVALIINALTRSPMFDYVVSWFGVLVFSVLTAYDHQKLRVIHAGGFTDQHAENAMVIMGALTLYLDFMNLFRFIVSILGASRD